ncbi:DUF4384 domain-containing protein [Bacteroidota bacterium]
MKFKTILTIFIFTSLTCYSQDGTWVETTGRFNGANVTPAEGKAKALELARSEAIKKVVGIKVTEEIYRNVSETSLSENSSEYIDIFSRLGRTTSNGKIIDEDYTITTELENNMPIYVAHISALVVEEIGEPDPGFIVEINMPEDVYYARSEILSDNDAIEFNILASKDCYIYLFNIMSSDSVQLILPNQYVENNFFDITKTEQEFEKLMNNLGMKFNVYLPQNKNFGREAFLVIALKEKIDFISDNLSKDGLSIIPTYKAAMTDIMSWLIQIPVNMRTEAFASFEIRRR